MCQTYVVVSQYSNRPPYVCSVHRGTPEEKLRIIFDAYDEDRSGEIDEQKMRRMLTSTLAIASKARRRDCTNTTLIHV